MGFDNLISLPPTSTYSRSSRLTLANGNTVRLSAYLWSHLYPIVIYLLSGFALCMVRFISVTDTYYSTDLTAPFDDSKDPFYAAHIADLHHTNIRPERMILNHRKIGNITFRFNPPVLSLGGDLIDALNSTNILSFHKQYEVNWHRYNTTRIESSVYSDNRTIFEVAGNHDMMVVSEDTNEKNRYRAYTMRSGEPLAVRSYSFESNWSMPINIILFNILRPPFTSGPLGVFPCAHSDDVQKLEDNFKRGYKNIIITHWPMSHWWSLTTTKRGNGLRDIGHMANMLLTGHLHPEHSTIERKQSTISLICPALFDTTEISMPFVDNGGSGVQAVDTADPNDPVLVTYPLRKDQLTSRSVFNLNKFPIRCYQFSATPKNVSVFIDGEYVADMVFLRTVRRHVQFYSLNVTVEDGDHKIRVGTTEFDFYVGDKIPPVIEVGNNNLYCPDICIYGAFRTLFFLILLLVPIWKLAPSFLEKYTNYIYGASIDTNGHSEINGRGEEVEYKWYVQLFLGPFYVITRARFLPKNFYVMFWILSCVFLVAPMYMMQDDQYLAVVFVWGALINHTFSQYAMCFTLWLIHLFFFCQGLLVAISFWYEVDLPSSIVSSNSNVLSSAAKWQWAEFAAYLIFALVGPIAWYILSYLAGGFFATLTAPITWVQIAAVIYTFLKLKNEFKEKRNNQEVYRLADRSVGSYQRSGVSDSSLSSFYVQDPALVRPLI